MNNSIRVRFKDVEFPCMVVKDDKGQTALEVAVANNRQKVLLILEKPGPEREWS